MPLKRYFDFEGQSRRKEYWMFTLLYTLVILVPVIMLIVGIVTSQESEGFPLLASLGFGLMGLIMLVCLIPSLAVQVRRFHDQDKSGWLVLLNLIPSIGPIIIIIFMCLEGTRGPNQYGPDPKA